MQDNNLQTEQKKSLIDRILSIETGLLLVGVASLVYGIAYRETINIFWGLMIVPGVFVLHKVRKKDWKAHWQEIEAEQQRHSKTEQTKVEQANE